MAPGAESSGALDVDLPAEDTLRVVVADDDVLLRAGLASLLARPGFEVVGQAGDASSLLELVRELVPDLVLVDIRMPPTQTVEGLDAARTIREEFPDVAILVLSAHVEVEHAMTFSPADAGSATCSRAASSTSTTSSKPCGGWPGAVRSSTRRSSRSWSQHNGATTPWTC